MTYQRAHNESGIWCIVVNASRDEIELLVQTSGTRLQVHWYQVLAEVASCRVDKEALPIRGFERDGGECSGCCVISLI